MQKWSRDIPLFSSFKSENPADNIISMSLEDVAQNTGVALSPLAMLYDGM